MINIPTELLRTLIAVVDLRSFTKAAQHLGVTQPAVSAQLKRLQILLGGDILDKSAPGVKLTALGDSVVIYARRMLSINDHILELSSPRNDVRTIRIALPGDFLASHVPVPLGRLRKQWPGIRFAVKSGAFDAMLRDIHNGDLDILVGLTAAPAQDVRHQWREPMTWLRGVQGNVDLSGVGSGGVGSGGVVPLVSFGDICAFHRLALSALAQAGLQCDIRFQGTSVATLFAAVSAGLGVMPYPRGRPLAQGMASWDDGPLPPLADLHCAIYLRDGGDLALLEQMADALAEVLKPDAPKHDAGRAVRFDLASPLAVVNDRAG
jgi:DNA-binding transcriptional LysR family regulator